MRTRWIHIHIMLVIYFNCMSHYVDFNECFFAETFTPMNAALTFQIDLNDCLCHERVEGNLRFQVHGKVSSEFGPNV